MKAMEKCIVLSSEVFTKRPFVLFFEVFDEFNLGQKPVI